MRWKDTISTKRADRVTKPKAINLYTDLTPAASAQSAKFTLSKPNATTVRKTILTDQQGKAVAQFALGSTYPKGTYKGQVSITVAGKVLTDSASVVI